MKRILKKIPLFSVVFLLLLPLLAMTAAADGAVQYDVKDTYHIEYNDDHTLTTITGNGEPVINIKIDFAQTGLYYSDVIEYTPKGEEYPELHAFVLLKDTLPPEDKFKRSTLWGYDIYYFLRDNKAVWTGWEIIGYVRIPELEMSHGPYFFMQFGLCKTYAGSDVPSLDYYGEENQRYIEADLLSLLSKVSISYEILEGMAVQPGAASQSVTTHAGSEAGDDSSASATIPTAVIAGIAAAAAAAATAGATGSTPGTAGKNGGKSEDEEQPKSTLRMIVSKNFGQTIRYGDEHVFVYARIIELFDKGGQRDRLDLTAQIKITTQSACLDLGPAQMAGDSMGASVRAPGHQDQKPAEAVITFSLAVGESSFTNNVVFQMMDWAEIKAEDSCMIVESIHGHPDSYETPYELINFFDFDGAQVTLEMKDKKLPFTIQLTPEGPNKGKIEVANDGSRQNTSEMFSYYFGKLTAKSPKDQAEKNFLVCTCRDGLYIDFGEGEKPEIKCYKKPDSEEMETTRALVGLARFDRQTRKLSVIAPDRIDVKVDDEKKIGSKIGLETQRMAKPVTGAHADNQLFADFRFKAIKPLPYSRDVEAQLEIYCHHNEEEYYRQERVKLKPDLFWYYDEFDKQYESLHKMVLDSFSPDVSKHYTHQLNYIRSRMGLADLQSYERHIRSAMQDVLEQRAEAALAIAENWDMAVTALEWTAWVGDICCDLLIGAFTGPLGTILADGGKDLIIDVARRILSDPNFSCFQIPDIAWDSLAASLTKNIDGLFEFPKPPAYAKIALWLTVFAVYRIYWHWENDKDEVTGKPLGLENACKSAARDVLVESALKAGMDRMLRGKVQLSRDSTGKHLYSKTTRQALHNARVKDERLIKALKKRETYQKAGKTAADAAVSGVKKLDAAATKALKSGMDATNKMADTAVKSMLSFINYVSDGANAAAIASFKAIGILK